MIIDEDIYDYIVVNLPIISEILENSQDICVEVVDDQWIIVHSALPDNRELNISSLGYYTIPKIYGLMEISDISYRNSNERADISSMEVSGAVQVTSQPYLDARGQGVIIGLIDTGIDYLRNNFRDSSGATRILAIWDQTLPYTASDMVSYGRVYESDDINGALRAYDSGGNPYDYVESRDTNGHGTFMAGIAASSVTDGYTGVAPQADIVCVKLKNAKQYLKDFFYIKDDVTCFEESDIMLAARFLKDYAQSKKKPLVIYIGAGSGSGSRTGATPLADVLDAYTKVTNTCVVVPAGNEAVSRTHFSGYAGVVPESRKEVVSTVVTKHARYRMKQRCGVGKRSAHRMAEKVYRLGVRHGETSGNLRKWVDAQYFYNRSANQIRLYGDKAYIFHDEKLITVIQIPHNLVPEVSAIRKFKEEKGGKKHESDRGTQKAD